MTHEELRDLINAEIPPNAPDPDWDYCQLWEDLHKAKNNLENLIQLVSEQEKASNKTTILIKRKLFSLECDFERMREDVTQ